MMRNPFRGSGNTPLLCAIGICLVYAAFFPAVIYSVDGNSMVAVAESLVTKHSFTVPIPGLGAIGRHGLYYSMWYPLMSILALPPVAIGVFVSHRLGLPQHYVAAMFALTLSPILAAATALMVALLARRLGATTRGAILASLGFAFGTIALVYSRLFFADPLLALLTVTGIYLTLGGNSRGDGRRCACGSAGQADWNSPWPVPWWLLAVQAAVDGKVDRAAMRHGGGTADLLRLQLDSLREPAEFRPAWSVCDERGAVGARRTVDLSWQRSAVVLPGGHRLGGGARRNLQTMGRRADFGRGRRVPGRAFDLDLLGRRMVVGAAAAAAGIAGTNGAYWSRGASVAMAVDCTDYRGLHRQCTHANVLLRAVLPGSRWRQKSATQARDGDPRYAPLLRIWGAAWRETVDAYQNADQVGAFVHQAGNAPLATSVEGSRTLRIVNLWWWMLPAVGIPRAAGAAVSLALLIIGLWLIARALARAPDDDGAFSVARLLGSSTATLASTNTSSKAP